MPDAKRYVLEDLEVREVSVVDRGANKRKLLVVKNQDGDQPMPEAPAHTEAEINEEPNPVVQAQAEKASAETDLIVSLPEQVRDGLAKMLSEVSGRLGALSEAVKATAPGEGGVSPKFKSEVVTLSSVLRAVVAAEKSEDIDSIEKTILAEVQPAVLQLGEGAPEYVMTADGPVMKMPMDAMKEMAKQYAMSKLMEAEDALYKGDYGGCCMCIYLCMKAVGPFVPDDGGMPQQMAYAMKAVSMNDADFEKQYAFNQPQPSIAAGVPDSKLPANMEQPGSGVATPGNMAKAGRKISGARLSKLEELLAQLTGVVSDLRPPAPAPVETAKADHSDVELRAKLRELVGVVKAQRDEIKDLRSTRPVGHAATHGAEATDKPSSSKVLWPDDLNELNDTDLD
jgi:hypothetical protein